MRDKMSPMARNKIWELVDLPSQCKSIGNKLVFKRKHCTDGSIDKFKAHLVAKGFTQIVVIDNEETFSLVVRFVSIRPLLTLVARLNLELFQMDVKTTILNCNHEKEIFMDQPKRFAWINPLFLYRRVKKTKCVFLKGLPMS